MVTDADLSVNLDGTTVLIQRTYDPLTRDGTGDFGYGWSLTNRQTNLQTNLPATGPGRPRRLQSVPRRHLDLPDAPHRPVRVHFSFAPASFQVAGQTLLPARLAGGLRRHLHPASTAAVLTKAGSRYYDLATGQPYNPGNPFFSGPSYTLTAPDGTRYQLDAQGNVTRRGHARRRAALHQRQRHHVGRRRTRSSSSATPRAGSPASSPPTASSSPTSTTPSGNLVAMQNLKTGGSQQLRLQPHPSRTC